MNSETAETIISKSFLLNILIYGVRLLIHEPSYNHPVRLLAEWHRTEKNFIPQPLCKITRAGAPRVVEAEDCLPSTDSAGLTATPRKKPRLGVDYSDAERIQSGRTSNHSEGIGATDLSLESSSKTNPLEAPVARANLVGKPYGTTVCLVLNIPENENDEDQIATQMAV